MAKEKLSAEQRLKIANDSVRFKVKRLETMRVTSVESGAEMTINVKDFDLDKHIDASDKPKSKPKSKPKAKKDEPQVSMSTESISLMSMAEIRELPSYKALGSKAKDFKSKDALIEAMLK